MLRRRVLWSVMTVFSLLVAAAATAYFRFDPDLYFPAQRSVYLTRQLPLHLHIAGALVALAAGPWQFAARLRTRRPRIHRTVGTLYLVGCLIGGLGGIALSTTAHGGAMASAGFAALGALWLATGAAGLAAILRGDVLAHRRWMVRSFSLTFAAVTLRVYLGIAMALTATDAWSVPFATSYAAIAWIAWVPNLAVAWWLTRRRPEQAEAPVHGAAALASAGGGAS
jgi:uncharacterized membrane protein